MPRGTNRQDISVGDDGRRAFLRILSDAAKPSGAKLHCCCLTDNHVHLLFREGEEALGQGIKRIAARYALRLDAKYERNGHLLRDGLKSGPVTDDAHLLALARLTCQNPVVAGICKASEDYAWSSCREYLGVRQGCADAEMVLGMMGDSPSRQPRLLKELVSGDTGEASSTMMQGAGQTRSREGRCRSFAAATTHLPLRSLARLTDTRASGS